MIRFWRRLLRGDPWVHVAIFVLVLVVAFVAAATPRLLETASHRQLAHILETMSPSQRDPSMHLTVSGSKSGAWEDAHRWPQLADEAEQVRLVQPAPLRGILGEAQLLAVGQSPQSYTPPKATGLFGVGVQPVQNPRLTETMRLVEGKWPTPGEQAPYEVVMAADVAVTVGAKVGDVLADTYLLTGIVEPSDASDGRWATHDLGTVIAPVVDANRGEGAIIWAYLAPEQRAWAAGATQSQPMNYELRLWYPVVGKRLPPTTDPTMLAEQLTNMLATARPLQSMDSQSMLESELGTALAQAAKQRVATLTLASVVAAGPLGLAAAVLALAVALCLARRLPHLQLLVARGASALQLRAMAVAEGVVIGLPAAAAGHLLAWLVPGEQAWWGWLVTAVIGLAPAAFLVGQARMGALGGVGGATRRDLRAGGSRARLGLEVIVAVAAVAACWQFFHSPSDAMHIDWLAVATPLLLAVVAGLVAMRLYPLPLAALVRTFRSGRGLVGFLGAARAKRDPAGGLLPTLALVLGVTVAIASTVLLGTIRHGAEIAAWSTTGADVKINGTVRDDVLKQIRATDQVRAAATVGTVTAQAAFTAGDERADVDVWVVDDTIREVWRGTPYADAVPADLFSPGTIMTGGDLRASSGNASLSQLGQVRIAGHLDELPGVVTKPRWVLVARSTWEAANQRVPSWSRTLIALHPGADAEAVARTTVAMVPYAQATTVASALEYTTDNPATAALAAVFVAACVATALLTAAALGIVQLIGGRSRGRLLAVLRTQGLTPRQAMGVAAWEVGPLAAWAFIVGIAAGALMATVVCAGVDLTGLTGGAANPALHIDPLSLGGLLLGLLAVLSISVVLTAWASSRANLAQTLRVGEE